MCELVVTSAGDVLDSFPDGHAFGSGELNNPEWKIVSVPDVPMADVAQLLSPGVATSPDQESVPFRMFYLDIQGDARTFSVGELLAMIKPRNPEPAE